MAMIKCKECDKEMSDHAKACPHCGYENDITFCPECDKQLSSKAVLCPNCGYSIKNYYSSDTSSGSNSNGEWYGVSILSLIFSFFPITSIISLVLAVVVLNLNKGKHNAAKEVATAALIFSCLIIFVYLLASYLEY